MIALKIPKIVRDFLSSLSVDFNVKDGSPRITIAKEIRRAQKKDSAHSTRTRRADHLPHRRPDPGMASKEKESPQREMISDPPDKDMPF